MPWIVKWSTQTGAQKLHGFKTFVVIILTLLFRVSVVDVLGELILDVIVRPENTLIDPNSKFSGLNSEQVLHADCDLNKVKKINKRVILSKIVRHISTCSN